MLKTGQKNQSDSKSINLYLPEPSGLRITGRAAFSAGAIPNQAG